MTETCFIPSSLVLQLPTSRLLDITSLHPDTLHISVIIRLYLPCAAGIAANELLTDAVEPLGISTCEHAVPSLVLFVPSSIPQPSAANTGQLSNSQQRTFPLCRHKGGHDGHTHSQNTQFPIGVCRGVVCRAPRLGERAGRQLLHAPTHHLTILNSASSSSSGSAALGRPQTSRGAGCAGAWVSCSRAATLCLLASNQQQRDKAVKLVASAQLSRPAL